MKNQPSEKEKEKYGFNPERLNNPNLKCAWCQDPIPIGNFCYEIIFEKGTVHICSNECYEHAKKEWNINS